MEGEQASIFLFRTYLPPIRLFLTVGIRNLICGEIRSMWVF
jgi:hypothetical protein